MEYLDNLSLYESEPALVFGHETYSYRDLLNNIDYWDGKVSNINPGSIVYIIGDYSFNAISLFFSLAKIKAIVIPVVSENEEEIEKRISVLKPNYIINIRKGAPDTELISNELTQFELIDDIRKSNKSGLVLFSSGSTGKPKAMLHDLDNLLATFMGKRRKKLSIMVFLMFDHIGGLNTLLNSLAMGAKLVIPSKREPEYVGKLIEDQKVNLLPASPTFLNMMLMANVPNNFDLKSLRMITYGTEAMPKSLLARIQKFMPKVKLLQTFGTSETGIAQTSSRSSSSLDIKFDDPNQEIKVVNGELWIRSKTKILGYLNSDMESFSDDGWFKTGDLVEESGDGFFKIIGRAKEVINVGGEKVLPAEVESVVLEVPCVKDCVAYAAPNAITGQTVVVNIVLNSDSIEEKEAKKEIRKHCKAKLDSYKTPTKIKFEDNMGINERFKKVRLDKYK